MGEFGEIKFVSTGFEEKEGGAYLVTGDLSMKGVTKSLTIELEFAVEETDPYGNRRVGLEERGAIDRTQWGVNYNAALESGVVLLGEKVNLEFDISAIAE